ncbi:hypothetical protein [Pseudomonas sp. yb_5]|uniref:hypothetical protein n=1 Tax=Pseudomonas sp. yb_5 TaxID=3367220 RepID=UPI00370C1666
MTPRLQLIARQMERREQQQAPAPVETSGLGAALEHVINEAVEQRVAAALQEQRRQLELTMPKPQYTSFEQIPPVPQTRAPKAMQATIQRDGAGVARAMVVNGVRYLAQRDAAGQLIGVVSEDKASEVRYDDLPVPPAKANRKLYGNDEV